MHFNLGSMEQSVYDTLVLMGGILSFVYLLFNIKEKKKFPGIVSGHIISYAKSREIKFPVDTVAAIVEIFIITILFYLTGSKTIELFGMCLGMSANYFGMIYFSPVLLVLGCYVLGLDVIKVFDMIAPAYPLGLIFSKLACHCSGCCNGMEWAGGVYNHNTKLTEVPIQLIEASWVLLIFIILFATRKKFRRGTGFPLYMLLYSGIRFFSEFFRSEPDIFLGLKLYQLCCISGVIIGIIIYIIAIKHADNISRRFTENNPIADYINDGFDKLARAYEKNQKKKQKRPITHHKKKKKR
ncbi:MAG: prolipoprotein diacylglyceryl transferase [Clostridia bacterium]|nr:prolipoprotein diacylglyceryl transferase [Clostridia bacterium]